MHIGIDFDGVIADIAEVGVDYARETWNLDLEPKDVWWDLGRIQLGPARYREMSIAVHGTDWTLRMRPIADAIESLHSLAANHELAIVTARTEPEGAWARRWFEAHELVIPDLITTGDGPKALVCEDLRLDVLLDDSPHNLLELPGTTHPVLLDAPHNRDNRPERLTVVGSWREFVDLCIEHARRPLLRDI